MMANAADFNEDQLIENRLKTRESVLYGTSVTRCVKSYIKFSGSLRDSENTAAQRQGHFELLKELSHVELETGAVEVVHQTATKELLHYHGLHHTIGIFLGMFFIHLIWYGRVPSERNSV